MPQLPLRIAISLARRSPAPQRCRVCGCTEDHACRNGCSWQPGMGNLCSTCALAVMGLDIWLKDARSLNWAALLREVAPIMRARGARAGLPPGEIAKQIGVLRRQLGGCR